MIYDVVRALIEVHHLENDRYRPVPANKTGSGVPRSRLWESSSDCGRTGFGTLLSRGCGYGTIKDSFYRLMKSLPNVKSSAPMKKQRAEQEKQRAEQEKQRAEQEKQPRRAGKTSAEQEKQLADKLAAKLRALGITPKHRAYRGASSRS